MSYLSFAQDLFDIIDSFGFINQVARDYWVSS